MRDLRDTGLAGAFNTIVNVPNLQKGPEVMKVLKVYTINSLYFNRHQWGRRTCPYYIVIYIQNSGVACNNKRRGVLERNVTVHTYIN